MVTMTIAQSVEDDLPCRVEPAKPRHHQVEDYDVRAVQHCQTDSFVAAGRLCAYRPSGLRLENQPKRAAYRGVIVSQQDPKHEGGAGDPT